jgi:hypothetical protein
VDAIIANTGHCGFTPWFTPSNVIRLGQADFVEHFAATFEPPPPAAHPRAPDDVERIDC